MRAHPPGSTKPTLLFDGDCPFCRLWVARWRSLTGPAVEYVAFQQAGPGSHGVSPEEAARGVVLLEPSGARCAGAEAVLRTLGRAPGGGWWPWAYARIPGLAGACEAAYRFVGARRGLFHRLTLILWGRDLAAPTYDITRWLFLRLLGVIYLIAFASLAVQVRGLVGESGVSPARRFFEAAGAQLGPGGFWILPSLCWWWNSDAALVGLCWLGVALAALLAAGAVPGPILAVLWVLYLSLMVAGQQFLSYQWDILLLETGLLALLWAPARAWWGLAPRGAPPSATALWLLRFLLWRLMFESGCVKILSGDAAWRSLSALSYHYETQCLPTWLAWYAHQLPAVFQKASVLGVFLIELGAPWLVFLPRRPRLAAFAALAGLQAMILLTGNYTFFNWLTLVLCLTLLDDAVLARLLPAGLAAAMRRPEGAAAPRPWWRVLWLAPAAAVLAGIGAGQVWSMLARRAPPEPVRTLSRLAAPLHAVNSYGLFAVMTTTRPEIIVEGSHDGREWFGYEFKWKPGDRWRRPAFVAPHQPRLDWQMWFAALGSCRDNPWFINFMARLVEGSAPVLALLERDPSPGRPPVYVRAVLYEYRFTDRQEGARTGAWWRRELKGLYCPVLGRAAAPPGGVTPPAP